MKALLTRSLMIVFVTSTVIQMSAAPTFASAVKDAMVACDQEPKCKADYGENNTVIFTTPGGGIVICTRGQDSKCEIQKRPAVRGAPGAKTVDGILKPPTKAQ
jgi:hypothetical protein